MSQALHDTPMFGPERPVVPVPDALPCAELSSIAHTRREAVFRHAVHLLHFTVDSDWRILRFSPEAGAAFALHEPALDGRSLRRLLIRLNPRWEHLLPMELSEQPDQRAFLAWQSSEREGFGWQFQSMLHQQAHFVSLVPQLAPEVSDSLAEDGLSADPESMRRMLHQLLLRTQQQEMRFRYFMRHLPGAHFSQNKDLQFSLLNESLIRLFGENCINKLRSGTHWWEWVHPHDLPEFNKNLNLCRNDCVPVSFRFRLLLPDEDRVLYLMDLRMPVRGLGGDLVGYEGLWLDLTRETLAEKRLQQASWKESLAEISGSLSHDFNNVLTGISSLAGLVYDTASPLSAQYDYLRIIRDSAQQAQGLIQRIVSLNREQSGQIGLHNLVDIVHNQSELIQIILPRDARFEVEIPDCEIPVRIDPIAIRRILLNFATNSRDALGRKGRVDLQLRIVDLKDYCRQHLLSARCPGEGPAAEIVFKDDGCGIDPAILHRIFGPYFSTKDSTHGSGLGLYSMTQFARENGFDFGVRSELGCGTDMILLIPLEAIELDESVEGWEGPAVDTQPLRSDCVAVFGKTVGIVRPILDMLKSRHFTAVHFFTEEEAIEWLDLPVNAPRALLISMDVDSSLPKLLCRKLADCNPALRGYLCLKGLNPDRFDSLIGPVFSGVFRDNSPPDSCVCSLESHLAASPPAQSSPAR